MRKTREEMEVDEKGEGQRSNGVEEMGEEGLEGLRR